MPGDPFRAKFSRRSFLRTSGLLAAPAILPALARADGRDDQPPRRARNAIFMVADGMSTGTLSLADTLRRRRDGRPSAWVSLWNSPGVRRAAMATHSADSLVTDSAAAGTTWGIGRKTSNGAIGITPDGRQHTPILPHARQAGKAVGIVTTTRVTHATPASFVANVPLRSMEREIGEQILARGIDVVLGGGTRFITPQQLSRVDRASIVADRASLLAAAVPATDRLIGLFSPSHMPFELDRPPTVPTLAEMTRAALGRLSKHPEGFVVQIEGGRVDHAAHSNDAGALVADQLAFDDAIAEVLAFTKDRDDTLVVITTDHGNGNPGMTLYRRASHAGLDRLSRVAHSFEWITDRMGAGPIAEQAARAADHVEPATGVALSPAQRDLLIAAVRGQHTAPFDPDNTPTSVLGAILANALGVGWVSPNHTSDLVEVTALGPGAERLRPSIDNTDLHTLLADALDLPPASPLPGADAIVPLPVPKDED